MGLAHKIIGLYHERTCEGGMEKSVPTVTVWHHKVCCVMTNGDLNRETDFLSHPHTNKNSFTCSQLNRSIAF